MRVQAEKGDEGGWVFLVSGPHDIVRPGVVIASVRVVEGEDDAPGDSAHLQARLHPSGGHGATVDVLADMGVAVEDLRAGGYLLLHPLPRSGHRPGRQAPEILASLFRVQAHPRYRPETLHRNRHTSRQAMVTGVFHRC